MSTIQNQAIARPYAEAAFRFAKQQNGIAEWQTFLNNFTEAFATQAMQNILSNPFIAQAKIVAAMTEKIKLNAAQVNLLSLLAEYGRLQYLAWVAQHFSRLCDQEQGVLRVEVVSAFTLNESTLALLQQKLADKFQKQIMLTTTIDPTLLGGFKIQIRDRILYSSL